MAQDGKTEKATPEHRKKQRKEGNLPKSKELTAFFNLLAMVIFLVMMGDWFVRALAEFQLNTILYIEDDMELYDFFKILGKKAFMLTLPIASVVIVFGIINYVLQVRFLLSWKIVKPNFKRLNPASYAKKIFNKRTLFEMLKGFSIVGILSYIVYYYFISDLHKITEAMTMPWQSSIVMLWKLFMGLLLKLVVALLFIGIMDFFFQRKDNEDNIKMSKQDVKDEYKQQNMDQNVQSKQRDKMLEIIKNDVVKQTKESDFILANPTHYSVAVRYRKEEGVPIVMAKGIDHVALFMREVANQNKIPIEVNPPVARELYNRTKEKEFIPEDMFIVISEIMKKLIDEGKLKIK